MQKALWYVENGFNSMLSDHHAGLEKIPSFTKLCIAVVLPVIFLFSVPDKCHFGQVRVSYHERLCSHALC